MRVGVLGPLTVEVDSGTVEITGALRRALLVRLAVDAGSVVSVDRLVDDLWGDDAPKAAVGTIQTYVSQLRKHVGEALVTRPPGYVLDLGDDAVDARRFELAIAEGRFDDALVEWRGDPLAEFDDRPWAAAAAEHLAALRLEAIEGRLRSRLEAGDTSGLIPECEALVTAHPLREGLWEVLITALYRAGRQSDALRAYQRLRATLAEELGIDPSPGLQALEASVLSQDVPAPAPPPTPAAARSLPTGVVTFVLTDIEGSTARWDADPDRMSEALELHDQLVERAVRAGAGRLLKSKGEGDATFSVFGRASDALGAAVDIQAALAAASWPGGEPLAVRVAVVTGEAIERNDDYYGTTVNRAARLRALAQGGEILVGESTAVVVRDHLPDGVALYPLGRKDLPGLSRPESVWVVGDVDAPPPAATVESSPGEASGLRIGMPAPLVVSEPTPCVGRDVELGRLRDAWGQGTRERLVLVSGEPGIGKTRLVSELAGEVHRDGATVAYGRCDPDLGVPYQPFAEALARLVAALPRALIAEHVGMFGSSVGYLAPQVAPRLGGTAGDATAVDDRDMRATVFAAVVDLLDRVARHRPVLLVLDDLHWADQPTLALLRHLQRAERDLALTIVATYRDTDLDRRHPLSEMLADLRRASDPPRIMVGGLTGDDVVAYIEAAADQRLAKPGLELAKAAHAETGGNPFFLQQILRHLVESGPLDAGGGTWQVVGDFDMPQGAVDAVGRRLSALDETTQRLLTWAAVAGHHFELATIEAADADLDAHARLDAVDRALRHRLLLEGEHPGQYRFAHAIVRDVIYGELSAARRAHFHQRIADVLADDPATPPAVLAHHYAQVARPGHTEQAATWALRAAEEALRRLAGADAVAHAERGLDLLEVDAEPDERLRAELLIVRKDALVYDEHPDADAAWRTAVESARAVGDARTEVRAASYRSWSVLFREPQREAVLGAAARRCLELPEDDPARVEFACGYIEYFAGLGDFQDVADPAAPPGASPITRANDLADQILVPLLDHPDRALRFRARLGLARLRVPTPDLDVITSGFPDADRQLLLDAEPPFANHELLLLVEAGHGALASGDRAAAVGFFERGRHFAHVQPSQSSFAAYGDAAFRIDAGDLREPEDLLKLIRASGHRAPSDAWEASTRWRLAYHRGDGKGAAEAVRPLLSRAGDLTVFELMVALGEALDGDVERGLDLVERQLARGFEHMAASRRVSIARSGMIVAAAGHAELAAKMLPVIEPYSGQIMTAFQASLGAADRVRGALLRVLGRHDEAVEALAAAVDLEDRMEFRTWATWSRYHLAETLLDRGAPGDDDRARLVLAEALEAADRIGMGWIRREGQALKARLDRVPVPAAIARADGPFVGRDDARAELLDVVQRGDDHRRVALVVGEPGIGKTRLVAEACRAAHDAGALVLFGHCDDGIGGPFQPFTEALRSLVTALGPERTREIAGPDATMLGGLVLELAPGGQGGGADIQEWAVNEAIDQLLSGLAAARPTVMVIDDLHWATPSTLAAVRHLATSHRQGNLTLVATYRDTDLDRSRPLADALAELRRAPSVHRLLLRGLESDATVALVGALVESDTRVGAVDTEFARHVAEQTEGNPFFVHQIVGDAGDAGSAEAVPEGIREVVGHRLSRLSDAANELLRIGSVMGRAFDLDTVAAAGGPPVDEALDAADQALQARVLVEAHDAFGHYEFAHALFRQTLYDELSTNRRVRLHWKIADALAASPAPPLAAIALHRVEGALAGDPMVAVDACLDAAADAIRSGARAEAEPLIESGLEVLNSGDDDPQRRANLLLARFWILRGSVENGAERLACYREMMEVLDQSDLEDEVVAALANARGWTADGTRYASVDDTVRRIDRALDGKAGQRPDLRGRLLNLRATTLSEPPPEPREKYPRSELTGRPWIDVMLRAAVARVSTVLDPDLDAVRLALRKASASMDRNLGRGPEHAPGFAALLFGPALVAARAADRASFERELTELADRLDLRRFPFYRWIANIIEPLRLHADGRLAAVREHHREISQASGDDDSPVSAMLSQIAIAEAGDLSRFLEVVRHVRQTTDLRLPGHDVRAGWAAFHLGDRDAAARTAERYSADDFALANDESGWALSAYGWLAELLAELGDASRAEGLQALLDPYSGQLLPAGAFLPAPLLAADRALGQLLWLQGQTDEAVAKLRSGIATEEGFGAPALAVRSRYWLARVLADRGGDDDVAEARQLVQASRAEADRLDMAHLGTQLEELGARLR